MKYYRFQQIKQYFYVSALTNERLPTQSWYMKLSPLFEHLRTQFKAYVLPRQNVSFDEMMVQFTGRSKHTLKMPNKPISEGYKMWAICSYCYTWDFLFYSRDKGK